MPLSFPTPTFGMYVVDMYVCMMQKLSEPHVILIILAIAVLKYWSISEHRRTFISLIIIRLEK